MKKAFGEYRYLAGGARARGTVWEGPDHLLLIESQGVFVEFTESYRRIDYSKVQAFTYGRTRTWGWTLAWQLILTALCLWPVVEWALHFNDRRLPDGLAAFAGLGAVVLLVILPALIINLVKGPTCICKVQTAVQTLHVKPIKRMKEARRVAGRLAELCLRHQGGAYVPEGQAASAGNPFLNAAFLMPEMKAPFTGSPLIRLGLLLLLVAGSLTLGEMFVDNLAYFLTDVMLAAAAGTILVVALIRSSQIALPGVLKGTLWGATVNFIFSMVLSFGLYIYASVMITKEMVINRRAVDMGNDVTLRLANWLSHASFNELDWCAWVVMGVGGLNVFFALLGLPSVLRSPAPASVSPVAVPPAMPAPVVQPPSQELPLPPESHD